MSQYIFRNIFFPLLSILVFFSCDDLPRDNILDPKNPASYRPQVVAVEAFVNTFNNKTYNEHLLTALDQLKSKYKGNITIAEYHRTVQSDTDLYHLDENRILQQNYVNNSDNNSMGVPDVFINGISGRVSGASSVDNVRYRLEDSLQNYFKQISYFTIEPVITRNNGQISISVVIAKIGSSSAENIHVKAIVIENINNQLLKRVVREIFTSDVILKLGNGEQWNLSEPWSYSDSIGSYLSVIFNITSDDELNIYQSIEVVVP